MSTESEAKWQESRERERYHGKTSKEIFDTFAESGAGATAPSTKWGDPVRFLTDDRDAKERHELVIQRGGNGDWYVSVVPEGHRTFRGVRICTSGGAAREVPGLGLAIANAYRAMLKAGASESGEQAPPSPICTDKQCQKFDAYHRVGQFGCSAGVRAGEATAPTPAEGDLTEEIIDGLRTEIVGLRERLTEAERERDERQREVMARIDAGLELHEKFAAATLAKAQLEKDFGARWQQALEAVEKAPRYGTNHDFEFAEIPDGDWIHREDLLAHLRSLSPTPADR